MKTVALTTIWNKMKYKETNYFSSHLFQCFMFYEFSISSRVNVIIITEYEFEVNYSSTLFENTIELDMKLVMTSHGWCIVGKTEEIEMFSTAS